MPRAPGKGAWKGCPEKSREKLLPGKGARLRIGAGPWNIVVNDLFMLLIVCSSFISSCDATSFILFPSLHSCRALFLCLILALLSRTLESMQPASIDLAGSKDPSIDHR